MRVITSRDSLPRRREERGLGAAGRAPTLRPHFSWSDLCQAPLHDFPVRDEILHQYLSLSADMDVLEIGPGSGFTAFWLARYLRSMALVDASSQSLAHLREKLRTQSNLSFVNWDLSQPRLAGQLDRSFDVAFGLDVFEYVHDPGVGLCNLAQALREGGQLLLTFPNTPPPRGDAVTYFHDPSEVEYLLEKAGFHQWRVFTIKYRPWAAFAHGSLHDWPLAAYRRLRQTSRSGRPEVYEQTWAFRNLEGLLRFKVPLNLIWAALGKVIAWGGDVFVEHSHTTNILGKRVVIWAEK